MLATIFATKGCKNTPCCDRLKGRDAHFRRPLDSRIVMFCQPRWSVINRLVVINFVICHFWIIQPIFTVVMTEACPF